MKWRQAIDSTFRQRPLPAVVRGYQCHACRVMQCEETMRCDEDGTWTCQGCLEDGLEPDQELFLGRE